MCGKFLTPREMSILIEEQRGSEDIILADRYLARIAKNYYGLDGYNGLRQESEDNETREFANILSGDRRCPFCNSAVKCYLYDKPGSLINHTSLECTCGATYVASPGFIKKQIIKESKTAKSGSERNYRSNLKKKITAQTVPEYHTMLLTLFLAYGYLKRVDAPLLDTMKKEMAKEREILVDVIRRWYSEEDRVSFMKEMMTRNTSRPHLRRHKPALLLGLFRDYLLENEYYEDDLEAQRMKVLAEMDKLRAMIKEDTFFLSSSAKNESARALWRLSDKLSEDYDWLLDDAVKRRKSYHWLYIEDHDDEVNLVFLIQYVASEWPLLTGQAATLDGVGELIVRLGLPQEKYKPKRGGGIAARLEILLTQMEEKGIVRLVPGGFQNTEYGQDLLHLSFRTTFQSGKNLEMDRDLAVHVKLRR